MLEPFDNKNQNDKFNDLYKSINEELQKMTLSKDLDVIQYVEFLVSSILLAINQRFPEPNYSIYITYRIKSEKSNIEKLLDYVRRLKENDTSISFKSISDLIGIRVIIEKIPHNVTISKENPEYDTLKELNDERKEYTLLSENYHKFESKINDKDCTYYEYYNQSKSLLENILKMFESETKYSKNYALDLKQKYTSLIEECEKKLTILSALGNYSSKIDFDSIRKEKEPFRIDFKELLKDFDSRIDSKLGLQLYSNALPSIISNDFNLKNLGITLSTDPSKVKHKREKSGYVSDFFELVSKYIPFGIELQIMFTNEHQESIIGYSAHSKMPGKEANFMETPPAYVNRNIDILSTLGDTEFIPNNQLSLFNKICHIKPIDENTSKLLKALTDKSNILIDNGSPIGIKLDSDLMQIMKDFCNLSEEERKNLESLLYDEGCRIYDSWAKNICAYHATARIDLDSSVKNRVKIHYDNAYECLAHTIREQVEGHTQNTIDSIYYLDSVYKNQSKWLTNTGIMATESSIMDFEIEEYAKNNLSLLNKNYEEER